jgi:hypothetical protein
MHVMARVYLFMFGLEILLTVLALISVLSADEDDVRALPRIVWLIVILLFPLVGAIVYFAAGRPLTVSRPATTWRAGGGFPEASRPPAPDDDPEFLRAIERRSRAAEEEKLRRWEQDLRRREDELRKRDNPIDDSASSDG